MPEILSPPRLLAIRESVARFRDRESPDRPGVAAAVRDGIREAGAPIGPEREANLAALARPGSVAIVTGQQVGFATGPLYTLYKALTVVAIARALRASGERDVVPVFWCASDDHDLAEVDCLRAPDPDGGAVRKFRAGIGAVTRTPAFAVAVDGAIRDAFERFAAAQPKTEFSDAVRSALSPRDGEGLATWFIRALASVPGLEELLPVEGRSLAPFGTRVVEAELRDPAASETALFGGVAAVRALGFTPSLAELTPPFLYELVRTGSEWQRIALAPGGRPSGIASPNVALRPVIQSEVLPAAAVVAGPGEVAYLSELGPLFDRHGVPRPVIVPRFSATLLDPRSEKTLLGLGLSPDAIFDLPVRAPAAAAVPPSFEANAAAAESALLALERDATAVDPSLEKPSRKLRENASQTIAKLREKVSEAAGAASETSLRRYRKLLGSVLPDDQPQERVFGPWTFFNQFGLDLGRAIGDTVSVSTEDFRHAVLRVSASESENV